MTNKPKVAEGGTRISALSVRVGDFVRFWDIRIQPRYSDEWWKVTAIAPGTVGPKLSLINAAGRAATFTPSRDVKVLRHDYSQRQVTA